MEKIAESCLAVRRPLLEPFPSEPLERCCSLLLPDPLTAPCPFPLEVVCGTSKYRCNPIPNRVAHFFRQSVAAALRSSPREMIELSFLDRVIRDLPNWLFEIP